MTKTQDELDKAIEEVEALVLTYAGNTEFDAFRLILATLRSPDPEVERDAERFRALMRCGRIKMQGSSGVDAKTGERNGNSVHFGAEFWPAPPKPEYAHLDGGERSTFWGRACIKALADAILEEEARAALSSNSGGR